MSSNPTVFYTSAGTPYLKEPGVSVLGYTSLYNPPSDFLEGFDKELDFEGYSTEWFDGTESYVHTSDAELVAKTAGQLCYMSFGPNRTKNAEAVKYFDNIKKSGHGSVLEHANFSLLLWGIDRAVTHELVRHRAGMAYSQVSQRYVDGKVLRFVERPEFQDDAGLHTMFEYRIDDAAKNYEKIAGYLLEINREKLASMGKRGARKAVNQAARALLPNETEAPIVVTGNVRAWRHFLEMRCSPHADVTIRNLALKVFFTLHELSECFFGDYSVTLDENGEAIGLETDYRKV